MRCKPRIFLCETGRDTVTKKDMGLYIELSTLGNFARNTAVSIGESGKVDGKKQSAVINSALAGIKRTVADCAGEKTTGGATEWLFDNWYIAQREGRDASEHFSRIGRLPKAAGLSGRSRVSEAASALVHSGRGRVTEERIRLFLDEYQKAVVLCERELYSFIPALKGELVIFLRELCPEVRKSDDGDMTLLMGHIFTSLRVLSALDASELLDSVNRAEGLLRLDPAGIYPLMDDETRSYYRSTLARLAKKENMTERDAAEKVLRLAQTGGENHVGHYIFKKPLGREQRGSLGGIYIAAIVLVSLFFTVLTGVLLSSFWAAVLLLIPISEIVKNLVDYASVRIIHPKRMPRLGFSKGIPAAGRTLCVISALLSGKGDGKKLAGLLEEYRISNRDAGGNLLFGILADLPESDRQRLPSDGELISSAKEEIDRLNREYGGGFYLLLREREYNEREGSWMGYERKRGAIRELVRLLSGTDSKLRVFGDKRILSGVSYIITLDSDTRLTAGSALEMVGTAMHPLNVPVIDKAKGCVTDGYGILQPRVSVELCSAGRSDFTRIFAGQGGIDPYGAAVSDVYQDLFGLGSFTGKGLINVPAYHAVLDDAFPENTVLSHDLLEGAYLRCAYLSDVEVTDGYPSKVTSYFDRMHRWTRGDWQNCRWLFKRVTNGGGRRVINPLGDVDKWKIFDNLRRSLVPVTTLLSLLAGMVYGGRAFAAAGLIAAASAMSNLLLSSAAIALRHDSSTRLRYHSTIVSGVAGSVMQTIIRLMLLPTEAWVQLSAILTAVYRMAVSHHGMLQWVTASDAEKRRGNTMMVNYIKLAACPAVGLAAVFLSQNVAAAAVGIVWIFTPAYAWALSREVNVATGTSSRDRGYLVQCAADIWRYFDTLLTPEDNFLPPDNFQEEPGVGAAHRTSPTNIGLALLSALAACDLGVADKARALELIRGTLATVKRLKKWNGHLYNWYDTVTAKPLEPSYVSTVDSGNLAGCLIVLKAAADELDCPDIRKTCEELLENMDFTPLFDNKRKLFYIGWDMAKGAPTEGWYDLLASEARQTSYVAIALGQVPRKHWRRLGRALVSQDNYTGMASWTGTMFEYLMPNLILPCYKNSLIYESSRFCIYAQKRANPGIPWGVSESAFYAFDPGLTYRYKAHGVQRLALKRGMGLETVLSPYSTFLALGLDPDGAVKNLKRMADLGAVGRFGFYEAIDFTPSRQRARKYEVVKTYMVHHLGMSIVAIANALTGDIMPRRFMADKRMAAFAELLQERVPTGEIVLRQPPREVPNKPKRQENSSHILKLNGVDTFSPEALPLSNGSYTVLLTEDGRTRSHWKDMMMTRWEADSPTKAGAELYLKTREDVIPLLPAPVFDGRLEYSSEFTPSAGVIQGKFGAFKWTVTLWVPTAGVSEVRRVDLSFNGKTPPEASVVFAFEPVIQRAQDFDAHPVFSKLCLEAYRWDRGVTVKRRSRGENKSVFLSAACDKNAEWATAQERGVFPESAVFKRATPEMRISAAVPLDFKNGKAAVTFALSPGHSPEEAEHGAAAALTEKENRTISYLGATALMLSMDGAAVKRAVGRIRGLLFSGRSRGGVEYKKEDLWKLGISGDMPIMGTEIVTDDDLARGRELVKEYLLLRENGVLCDLVLVTNDGSDYRCPQRRNIMELLTGFGRENVLGTRGGVHFVDAREDGAEAVKAMADVWCGKSSPEKAGERNTSLPMLGEHQKSCAERRIAERFRDDGTFELLLKGTLPPAAWSNILANDDYGFLATEAGTGHMWYKNSREMRINRCLNDPMTATGTERLELVRGTERKSLFASGDGCPVKVSYGFGWASWEKDMGDVRTKVTAFVPKDTAARVLIVETDGADHEDGIFYYTDLVLGEGTKPGKSLRTDFRDGVISAWDKTGAYGDFRFTVTASREPDGFTTDHPSALTGQLNGMIGTGEDACCAAVYRAEKRLILVTGCAPGGEARALCDVEKAREKLAETREYWRHTVCPVTISTPEKTLDDYINGWALYQVVACRMTARTGLYQNGGAFGFRDQLQDAMAVIPFEPERAARQLRLAAEHQYTEGDVMHWWHPAQSGDKGVRTRCSDDLLWLPWVLCDYVNRTGDWGICRVKTSWRSSRPLEDNEDDRYEVPIVTHEKDSLLEHAKRAADAFIGRGTGEHGLALMLGGDWNDGMNKVGEKGRGESVWLTWFGSMTLSALGQLCSREGDKATAERYMRAADALKAAAERAVSGDWYLRGYYDDGTPLGAEGADECAIDSIAQSFSVFACAEPAMSKRALLSAYDRLYDRENRLIKLFTPPFDDGEAEPGYIKGYAPGYRENGGQYTHGAVWLAMAMLDAGYTERGWELIKCLLPGGRDRRVYRTEPYVLCGDVYDSPDNRGRGGWSWYTGAAGWMFRAVTESLLGLRVREGRLYIEPNLPKEWSGCTVNYRAGNKNLRIEIGPAPDRRITVNGKPCEKDGYSLNIHNNSIYSAGKM